MRTKMALAALAGLALVAAGCGSSNSSGSASTSSSAPAATTTQKTAAEKSPPGDIPDSTAFVAYKLPGAGFSVKVPEGWARTGSGQKATFTSNLNSVTIESRKTPGSATSTTVKKTDIPALAAALKGFHVTSVGTVQRGGQTAVRIRYTAQGQANAVTGKALPEEAERYVYAHNGTQAVLTLSGPKGADNVDPWKTITDSLRWTQ